MRTLGNFIERRTYSQSDPLLVILLATFNGEKYLVEQLESIVSQTYSNWIVLARDDQSSDSTLDILDKYVAKFPDRFFVDRSVPKNLGAKRSFLSLMQMVSSVLASNKLICENTLILFSDQDDIWDNNKLKHLVSVFVENDLTRGEPFLIHTDLELIDECGRSIAPSMEQYQGLFVSYTSLLNQTISNSVTGCTMAINICLLEKALKMGPDAVMHDWWISMVASAFGKRIYLKSPLVRYRQHNNNTIGATPIEEVRSLKRSVLNFFSKGRCSLYAPLARQAQNFLKSYGSELGLGQSIQLRLVSLLDCIPCPLANVLYMFLVMRRNVTSKNYGHR